MEKIKEAGKLIWKYNVIIEFLLCLIFGYILFNIICFKAYNDIWHLNFLILGTILLIPICFIVVKNIIENKEKLEKVFLTIAIPLSIGYMVFVLINYIPDENWHIYRAYNIANGNIIVDVGKNNETIPKEMTQIESLRKYSDLINMLNQENKLNNFSEEENEYFNTFEIYFPMIYIGPVVGIKIAELFNFNIIIAIYLMRLMNVIIFLTLGYFTVKWMPFGKLLTTTYLCIPMFIHQAASPSGDAFINSMCLLFIAYNMKLIFKKRRFFFKRKNIICCFSIRSNT